MAAKALRSAEGVRMDPLGARPPAPVASAVWDGVARACGLAGLGGESGGPSKRKGTHALKRKTLVRAPDAQALADAVLDRLCTHPVCGRGWTVVAGQDPSLALRGLRKLAFRFSVEYAHRSEKGSWRRLLVVCKCDSLRGPAVPARGWALLQAAAAGPFGDASSDDTRLTFALRRPGGNSGHGDGSGVGGGDDDAADGDDGGDAPGAGGYGEAGSPREVLALLAASAAARPGSASELEAEAAAATAAVESMGRESCLAVGVTASLSAVRGGAWHAVACADEEDLGVASDAALLPGVLSLTVTTAAGAAAKVAVWGAGDAPEAGAMAASELASAGPTLVRKAALAIALVAMLVAGLLWVGCPYLPAAGADAGVLHVASRVCANANGVSLRTVAIGAAGLLVLISALQKMFRNPKGAKKE
ncbi:hypothetical protein FNF27_03178 [Cafeteria roenbergensis]|uniref:Uncharacterized protein n=1 Tax=Cafeteria roenbergensis TaxID=33653 RepID=A0A5A8EDZ1_CAFRO|nr:hypothetical protein FNF27_03178 [Cafeteria roenbergensis]